MDSIVLAAWIGAAGLVISSFLGSAIAIWYGRRSITFKDLEAQLKCAQEDIKFLLQVEKAYANSNKSGLDIGGKNTVRETVRNAGYTWSGKNTPGRVLGNS